jgi:hypothetical protein
MFMFSGLYSVIFWIIVVLWPFAFESRIGVPLMWTLAAVNAALIVLVVEKSSSKDIGFIGGMDLIAGSMMSGCANITILYLPPLMVGVYLIALFHSLVSLRRGRDYSQDRWRSLVESFQKNRMNAPLNPLADRRRPLEDLDPFNPQDLLEGASRLEMEGEWDKAIELYGLAAEMLKDTQDGVYAKNCIKSVREKIAMTQRPESPIRGDDGR